MFAQYLILLTGDILNKMVVQKTGGSPDRGCQVTYDLRGS